MKPAKILYTNYTGETRWRLIFPQRVWFGITYWHLVPQWLLDAHDVDKNEQRTFALANIHQWTQEDLACRQEDQP